MRVTAGHNPYKPQQKANSKKDGDFAGMLAGKAKDGHGSHGAHGARDRRDQIDHSTDWMKLTRPDGIAFRPRITVADNQEDEDFIAAYEKKHGKIYDGPSQWQVFEQAEIRKYESPEPKYPKSIYDIPESELEAEILAAVKACSMIDTDGTSQGEIYNSVETIFKNYLGKDFKEPCAIYNGIVNFEEEPYLCELWKIPAYFKEQLRAKGISAEDHQAVLEARGYKGMSESEIRSAVREKYPKNMTFKDCMIMGEELCELGLEEFNYGHTSSWHFQVVMNMDWSPQFEKLFDAMMNIQVDYETLKASQNTYVKNEVSFNAPQNMDELLKELSSWFGKGISSNIIALLKDMEAKGEFRYYQ